MVQTSQLGISKYAWWMEIWKCWDSLQPSTFTGIPLPGGAISRKYELFPSPLWLQHVLPVCQSPTLYFIFDKSQEPQEELQTIPDDQISGIQDAPDAPDQIDVRSCLPLVFITNSGLAQLKCLAICHLVIEKITSHLPRTKLESSNQVTGMAVKSEL